MLVVKVEIHPWGDASRAREIGRIEIANTGGDEEVGEYSARVTEEVLLEHIKATADAAEEAKGDHDRELEGFKSELEDAEKLVDDIRYCRDCSLCKELKS